MVTIFDTKRIHEIELVAYTSNIITSKTLSYLPNSCYEKITSVEFGNDQNADLMNNLFSRSLNLRELSVNFNWIISVLQGLHRGFLCLKILV